MVRIPIESSANEQSEDLFRILVRQELAVFDPLAEEELIKLT